MDVRRIQITGGSSYMVTLPKDWAESVGLKKNDPVGLKPHPDGTLVIYPGGMGSQVSQSVKTIDADGITDGEYLYRQLVGAYIAGHDVIELRSATSISSLVTSTASAFTQTAIGLEIMEESEDAIVIKDLMDQTEMSPLKSVDRMRVLVRNMLTDAIGILETRFAPSPGMMNERDREVDRLDWLVSRQVNIHQKDITLSNRMGLDLCSVTRCGAVSRTVERIGDHAVMISTHLSQMISSGRTVADDDIISLGKEAVGLFSGSMATWTSGDMVAANRCIEKGKDLVVMVADVFSHYNSMDESAAMAMEAVLASLKRVIEYSMDIGEMAINSAMD